MDNIRKKKKGMGYLSILGLILVTILISVGVTVWIINSYIFPKKFKPVVLSQKEESVLDQKLKRFQGLGPSKLNADTSKETQTTTLAPEKYSEDIGKVIRLTERELNALLAKNTDLSDKLAIDLSDNLLSVKLLIPIDQEFPFIGGKTIKVTAGMELAFKNSQPIVMLKGVSLMGVPIPNAWLGGLKNIDLIKEFGQDAGFWKAFSEGVEDMHAEEGRFMIKLKE
ncbi:MAG: arginine N-succinyltransferase [Candidatus Scalindua sp.]|nr:arginine N-succinyltransferase [Candidatus Scalindua sp.]